MLVDFHVHSAASDGTFAPRELAEKGASAGFAAMAITDHDNTDGVGEYLSACAEASANGSAMRAVAGVELSIEPGEGFDKFHLLGLGVDPENASLKALLKRVLDGRNDRNERIFANFRRIGIPHIAPEPHGEVLARPHFARWLCEHGYARNIGMAFDKYLLPDSPHATRCYEERMHPSREEAFAAVHAAGGLCIMAHPKFWRRSWKSAGPEYADAERELAALREMGLDGIEARYQANAPEEDAAFTDIASRLGLLKTAGSDFHGANKPTISLGMEVSDEFIGPFLERVHAIS
ncbi:MAG: PHP domain-containing protein [Kiritimatiellae bacterium]|nr:PHP domain-containing protein [Kiritimatiellia bacterium]